MTDIEIASSINKKNISEVASRLKIEDKIEYYGKYKAKINKIDGNEKGKLILVTSINPTPYGEGKTTMSIGINDALNKLNKNSMVVLQKQTYRLMEENIYTRN